MDAHSNTITSSLRRWYHFAYFVHGHDDRGRQPHQTRDDGAALCLTRVLLERGFAYHGPIYNYPVLPRMPGERYPVDDSFVGPADLVVLTTRPPMDDLKDGHRGPVDRSHTTLEEKVFASLRQDLDWCSRWRVMVADCHARSSADVARLSNVQFRQNRGATVDRYQSFGSGRWTRMASGCGTTVAYLIYRERAWPNGPSLLASFGMCGTDTLGWNYLLATRFPELVLTQPFVMAEITAPPVPEHPLTVDFCRNWTVRLSTPSCRRDCEARIGAEANSPRTST